MSKLLLMSTLSFFFFLFRGEKTNAIVNKHLIRRYFKSDFGLMNGIIQKMQEQQSHVYLIELTFAGI